MLQTPTRLVPREKVRAEGEKREEALVEVFTYSSLSGETRFEALQEEAVDVAKDSPADASNYRKKRGEGGGARKQRSNEKQGDKVERQSAPTQGRMCIYT